MVSQRWMHAVLGVSLLGCLSVRADLQVHPQQIELRHQRHGASILVFDVDAQGYSVDHGAAATFVSADPKVAVVEAGGWVRPVGNGKTTVTAGVGGVHRTIAINVTLPAKEPPISFRHEVMPVFTKGGCNQGACHGYSLGKNGFKLSLRGQEYDQDYPAVVRDATARRINYQDPASSLLLTKACGQVVHEGGARLVRGGYMESMVQRWIREGCPDDRKGPAQVVGIRIVPETLTLEPGKKHRLQMIARYDDGSVRDVTRLGVFAVNNPQFGSVDDDGMVTAGDYGETAVVGRFERTFAAVGVTVLKPDASFRPTAVPGHVVDRHVVEKLNRIRVSPSPVAADEEFLRRVYLDVIGVQPKPDEVRAFLKNTAPDKRSKLIDELFTRPEYVDHWSLKWGDLLQNTRNSVSVPSMWRFREYIRSAVAENRPLDEFTRQILTARGSYTDDPASVFYAVSKTPDDTVERVTQVFCGVRMLCARCHTHPLENWTQADYYGVESFFTQISARADARFPNVPNSRMIAMNPSAGFAQNPRTRRAQPPKFLGGDLLPGDHSGDRRAAYADWLTSPKNPFFARGMVNRVWSYFFHRGIIDPVDDIRSTNPPINPALLDALTAEFISAKFDFQRLVRLIVTSETYQRTTTPNESNRRDDMNFARAIPRRIPAEALLDSLIQATAVPESFAGTPGGFRAAQLPDGNSEHPFLRLFGKPQRMDACECERDNGSNMLQALHFINGKSILNRVQNPAARPALLMRQKLTDDQLIEELYLWAIARRPTEKELALGRSFLAEAKTDKTPAVQDLMWALLNSKGFMLNH